MLSRPKKDIVIIQIENFSATTNFGYKIDYRGWDILDAYSFCSHVLCLLDRVWGGHGWCARAFGDLQKKKHLLFVPSAADTTSHGLISASGWCI